MPSYINTNISSLQAQLNLSNSQSSLATSLQRLSSGLRINSAADDAAGLAIATRMTSQINGLTQATRNANDAISLAQTAGGALSGITNMLQSLRNLAVQSANSTNTATDRAAIQQQATALVAEIQRTATTTQFNGLNLLDGTYTNQSFQVGTAAGQTIAVSIGSATTDKLGSSTTSALTATNNGTAMSQGDLVINGISVGGSLASYDTSSTTSQASSAISKAAAINAVSAQTGVTAKVDANIAEGAAMVPAAVAGGTFTINNVSITATTGGTSASADRGAVIAAINAASGQTGVVATDSGTSAGGVILTAADGRNINVSMGTMTSAASGLVAQVSYGTYTLTSQSAINISGSTTIANSGLAAGTYSTQTAYATTTQLAVGSGAAFTANDFSINGIMVGASLASSDTASTISQGASAIAKAAAVNAVSSQTGVTATASTLVQGTAQTATAIAGTIAINGVSIAITTTGVASSDRSAVVNAINAVSGQTGVTATDGGSSAAGVQLHAADGRNVNVSMGTMTSAASGLQAGVNYGTLTLSSASQFTIAAGTTGNAMAAIGMLDVGTYGVGQTGQSLNSINLSTAAGATNAITAIDNAINSVNSTQATLGAIQNRFTQTISTLQSTTLNLSAARSRIQDTDFAAETANMTKAQILQQAGTAMLAQANQLPNTVLSLLK